MFRRFGISALLIMFLLSLDPSPVLAAGGSVFGMVLTSSSQQVPGQPFMGFVEGAQVTISGTRLSTVTDSRGMFQFPDVPKGNRKVVVTKTGFATYEEQIEVKKGVPIQLKITLVPQAGAAVPAAVAPVVGGGAMYVAFASMETGLQGPGQNAYGPESGMSTTMSYMQAIASGADPMSLHGNAPPDPMSQSPMGYQTPMSTNPNSIMILQPAEPQRADYINLGARPFWLCFNTSGTKLFVANDQKEIMIIDTLGSNSVVGRIMTGGIVKDLLLSPDGSLLYAAVMSGNPCVYAISPSSNAAVGIIPMPRMKDGSMGQPQALAVSPDSRMLFVSMAASGVSSQGEVIAIDTSRQMLLGAVPVGATPMGMAIPSGGERLFVANYNSGSVSVISTRNLTLLGQFRVGVQPVKLASSPDGSRVYVSNSGSGNVSVIDVSSARVCATVQVGANPMGIAVSPEGNRVYVANNGSGTVSVIDPSSMTVIQTTSPQPRGKPFGIAVKP